MKGVAEILDAESDDEMPGERTDELGQAAIDADSNSAGDMDSHAASSAEQAPASRLGQHGIERYKAMITDYHNSARSDPMELPSSLTDAERMVLHRHAEQYGLEHRSQGPASVRCIVIKRWAPIQTVAASIGDKAVGALVARDHQGRVYRGYVSSFDRGVMRWEVAYSDLPAPLGKEMLDVDSLNLRMQRRFDYDHGENGLGEPGARPARGARLSVKDGETLARLLAGVDENWTTSEWSYLYYDPAHWMRIFGSMLAVDKHSDIEKVFNGWLSETLFKLLPGEQERGRLHAKKTRDDQRTNQTDCSQVLEATFEVHVSSSGCPHQTVPRYLYIFPGSGGPAAAWFLVLEAGRVRHPRQRNVVCPAWFA